MDGKETFPIVFATDDNYLPYMTVAMQSVIENHAGGGIRFYVFYRNLETRNMEILERHIRSFKDVDIKFIDVSEYFMNNDISVSGYTSGYTLEVYFRLLIPYLLSDYEKVLYLDCDIVCLEDIAGLLRYDIGDALLACSRDFAILKGFENFHVKDLGIKNCQNYFNAGVLLFNNSEFSKTYSLGQVFKTVLARKYSFNDQDVLNILCENRVFYLPMAWNVMANAAGGKEIPARFRVDYRTARLNPKIIHNTFDKPWKKIYLSERWERFWKYAKNTPFFHDMIQNLDFSGMILDHDEIYNDVLGRDRYGLGIKFFARGLFLRILKKFKFI
jgi:lipopolysaccharide biosynthesis glycosyltransferase